MRGTALLWQDSRGLANVEYHWSSPQAHPTNEPPTCAVNNANDDPPRPDATQNAPPCYAALNAPHAVNTTPNYSVPWHSNDAVQSRPAQHYLTALSGYVPT
jgi:hypothetical protein